VKLEIGQGNINFVNGLPCNLSVTLGSMQAQTMAAYEPLLYENIKNDEYQIGISYTGECAGYPGLSLPPGTKITLPTFPEDEEGDTPDTAYTLLVGMKFNNPGVPELEVITSNAPDDRKKPEEGMPKLRFYLQGRIFEKLNAENKAFYLRIAGEGENEFEFLDFGMSNNVISPAPAGGWVSEIVEVEPISYRLFLEVENEKSLIIGQMEVQLGGSYVSTITPNLATESPDHTDPNNYVIKTHVITTPSSMHMFWLLPQYIILTMAEIMFSVTGLEFSYSQSPVSMKSVLQAAWLLTVAFGNLIVVIVAEAKFFEEQSKEFFLFAGLIFVAMAVFSFQAWRYIPAQLEDPNAVKEIEPEDKDKKSEHDD